MSKDWALPGVGVARIAVWAVADSSAANVTDREER